jgi:iron complex transport system substrate-binding protein
LEGDPPKVLFVFAHGAGTWNVAGVGTAADEMIRLAGGRNAATGYAGYRPLTAEAVVAAQPDVILTGSGGLAGRGGQEGLLKVPGVGSTPAGRDRRVVAMDELYLLGFGPRTAEAVRELNRELSGER